MKTVVRLAEDDHENDHRDEQLDEAVALLSTQKSPHEPLHFDLDCTSLRALWACRALLEPMPQNCWARRSTAMRVVSASAPRHQPNFAPVTIQAFW